MQVETLLDTGELRVTDTKGKGFKKEDVVNCVTCCWDADRVEDRSIWKD